MKKRRIQKVAILGSGVMGSRIACHFANIGVEVLLLDIAPKELTKKETEAGLDLKHNLVKNRIVNDALKFTLSSSPSPIYLKEFAVSRITTGNFEDDLEKIKEVDWILEAIIENLDIKKDLFKKVEKHRKEGSIISSNTSGIPINLMLDGRSDDFKRCFIGTHFFNPPRYLELLELIPTPKTDSEVLEFLKDFGNRFLGKTTVVCKDTPAFIANRIGVYSIMSLFHLVKKMGLTIDEVDKLTGPIIGRPKSATFRTCDVVGLDTLVKVANGLKENCPNDEGRDKFEIPDYIEKMVSNNWLGSKTKQGFFKKIKNSDGKKEILSLNLKTLEYEPRNKVKFPSIDAAKPVENLRERIKIIFSGKDRAGEFTRAAFLELFQYVSLRIPEISEEIYKIDDAVKAGFGWKLGPFELWDTLGVENIITQLKEENLIVPEWVNTMTKEGITSFYKIEKGSKRYYDLKSKGYSEIAERKNLLLLENLNKDIIWKNSGAVIRNLGDGIVHLEFNTKMNTIGGEVLQGIHEVINLAEKDYDGVVISNRGDNFSVGANVGMILMLAADQEYDELNFAIKYFQDTMMRLRYSSIPVIVAPHGMSLGGGCELSMHADKVVAHAETYMGLVEFGVGVIPGGGGTKEFTVRSSDEFMDGNIEQNVLKNRFLTIGQAKVSTSAHEAFGLGYLRNGIDEIIVSRTNQLSYAKKSALNLAEKGYTQPAPRKDIKVLGNQTLGMIGIGANSMYSGNYISEHDKLIAEKLGYVMCGGDLSVPTMVNEQYLLDLERRAFLELCMERKTLERMQSIIQTGKVLRN